MEQQESGNQEAGEEIKIMEKEISLGLSEEEYGILDSLCSQHGISVGQLFKRFSKDLIGWPYMSYYGGFHKWTEEAGRAKEWFVHCDFGKVPRESLLGHLFTYRQDIRLFLQLTDLIESGADREAVAEYLKRDGTERLEKMIWDVEDFAWDIEKEYDEIHKPWGKGGFCMGYLKDVRKNMIEMWAERHPEADMGKETEAVREWYEKRECQEHRQEGRVWEGAIGGRHISLRLTERDYGEMGIFFREYGVTAGQVFVRLARNLVDAHQAELSQNDPRADEARRAEEWFSSCQFGRFPEESLVNYLVAYTPNADDLVRMSEALGLDTFPDVAVDYIDTEGWKAEHPDANVRVELLAVKEWQRESVQQEREAPAAQRKGRGR